MPDMLDGASHRHITETEAYLLVDVASGSIGEVAEIYRTLAFLCIKKQLRRDDVRHFAGAYRHELKKTKDGYRIKLQRVDMTNAQAAYDYVLQVWI